MNSTNARLTALLRAVSSELAPYSEIRSKGSRHWNGEKYVEVTDDSPGRFQRGAAIWRTKLDTIADLIDLQPSDLSTAQREYLTRTLFGGMGSLHDFGLEETADPDARSTNARLVALYRELYEAFTSK
jgi:hypothetical protein